MQHTEITKDHSKYHRTKTAANQKLQQTKLYSKYFKKEIWLLAKNQEILSFSTS